MKRRKSAFGGSPAFHFVLTMGVVNLFGDITYEGGASINGPFLATLGGSAAAISIIAGVGEFLGYSLRSVAGYAADRTGKYWLITFIGYAINLFAVPAMALAGDFKVAAALILAERIGRAIRKPTVEAMLSYTTNEIGRGWVYALNNALDEIGATLGPLLMALVLVMNGSYRTGYALLLISVALTLASLVAARIGFPLPSRLEQGHTAREKAFTRSYWVYVAAGAFFAAGLMSFEFISYHLSKTGVATAQWIPLLLAISTGFGVIASLVLGRLYDRTGLPVVLGAVALSALFAPLVFFGGFAAMVAGMLLWGLGYAVQDTLLKALIAGVLPEAKRNLAFGLFYAVYGLGWLIGSAVTGLLYEQSHMAVVIFSVAVQAASLPLFVMANRQGSARHSAKRERT
jgi:MFS family permease